MIGYVGGDGDVVVVVCYCDDGCFLFVVFGVEYIVWDVLFGELL